MATLSWQSFQIQPAEFAENVPTDASPHLLRCVAKQARSLKLPRFEGLG